MEADVGAIRVNFCVIIVFFYRILHGFQFHFDAYVSPLVSRIGGDGEFFVSIQLLMVEGWRLWRSLVVDLSLGVVMLLLPLILCLLNKGG